MNNSLPLEARNISEFARLPQLRLETACNENVLSATATELLSSPAASRYYFKTNNENLSDFPEFVAPGYPEIDRILERAKQSVMTMTGAGYVNLAPISGIHAMIMVIVALTKPGETIASLDFRSNGHFATQSVIEKLGRKSVFVPRLENGKIDNDRLAEMVDHGGVTMLYLDMATHLEPISAKETKRLFGGRLVTVCDASHGLGLIMGGKFEDPFNDGFDVVCANTHKTFPGPHRGIVLAKDGTLGSRISEEVDSKLYSSVHFGSLLAMAITIFEMEEFGDDYANQVVKNSNQLTRSLEAEGFNMAKCYDGSLAKNQHVHMTFAKRNEAYDVLVALLGSHIVSHLCHVERDGYIVRLGTQEITRRGMKEDDMKRIAVLIKEVTRGNNVAGDVEDLVSDFPNVMFSFDQQDATVAKQ